MQPTLMEQNKFKIKRDSIMFIAKNLRKALISSCVLVTVLQSYCAIVLQGDSTNRRSIIYPTNNVYTCKVQMILFMLLHTHREQKIFQLRCRSLQRKFYIPMTTVSRLQLIAMLRAQFLYMTHQIDQLALMSGRNMLSII
jgi:hypothetical protein